MPGYNMLLICTFDKVCKYFTPIIVYEASFSVAILLLVTDFKRCPNDRKKGAIAYIIAACVTICTVFLLSGILWWKGCIGGRTNGKQSEGDIK